MKNSQTSAPKKLRSHGLSFRKKTAKILVSPSAASALSEDANEWFHEFFDICMELGCRVDYLAPHSYSANVDNVGGAYETVPKVEQFYLPH